MSGPRPPAGGAGVRESVSGQLDWAHDTANASPSVAQCVTRLPVPSLVAALDPRRGGRARIAYVAVEHESDCPVIDPYGQGWPR